MTQTAIRPSELPVGQIEPNNLFARKLWRRAFPSFATYASSDHLSRLSAGFMQCKLPCFIHNPEKNLICMHFKDTPKSYAGDKDKLYLSATDNGGRMGYDTSRDQFPRLKLGRNLLNFFTVSDKLYRPRVDTLEVDEFEGLMDVGTVLLKEGEQGLDGRLEVGVAARMLKEAALRFAAASAIDPLNVAAVDAWGITLLAHGKLKLLLSEKLRDTLLEARTALKKLDTETTVASLEDMIPKTCEDCEKLLLEAGRKFGKAVSLEKSNDFALYNWGLALFYRARLIAADGLEDAVKDADKIYLTAIDKFTATIQLNKDYSGAAYLSWGLALRDRYWLGGSASKEDTQLLEKAKWASEQALQAYPNRIEAKLVVQTCMEELEQLKSK